ncbi:MAG: type II toxin-antitoxin system VapC family toxin [Calditrichaeota bacterium]|nr:type II toxin-antitoxin system VapC family toxin [Calditrichota bacterium]
MKLLLDTHTFIWWASEPTKLSKSALDMCKNRANTLALDELPFHHKDPFDRLLIAQSNLEKMVILSKDKIFSTYTAKVMW